MNISGLNFYHLKYFQDVVRFSSFSKAAEANFISRPAVSKAIRRLEEIVGYPLFDHEKKAVRLTKEGRLLAAGIEPILKQLIKTVSKPKQTEQVLSLGVSYSIFKALLLEPLKSFLSVGEKHSVNVQFGTSRTLIGLLAAQEIDIAILLEDTPSHLLKRRQLRSGYFVLAAPKTKTVSKTLITTEVRPETLLIKRLNVGGFSRHIELASWSACVDFIEAKIGVGLIPDFLFNSRTMRCISIGEKIPYTVWAVCRSDTDLKDFLRIMNNI